MSATRDRAEALLRGWGITDRPWEFGDGIHSWRCEHPDRYGECKCFEECLDELVELIEECHNDRRARGEGWD